MIPNFPTPEGQTYLNWTKTMDKIKINPEDIIIGWSTGSIFAVRYLFEHKIKIKKLILVSGFNNYVGKVAEVDKINKDFFMRNLSSAKDVADEIVCFKSDNDPFISQNALNDFAEKLDAKIVNIKNGGHFNKDSGYCEFYEILEEL